MLYILSNSPKSLKGFKIIVMNNKLSISILIAFLFFAFSCKSESKKDLTLEGNTSIKENSVTDLESNDAVETKIIEPKATRQVVEKVEETPKEVKLPPKNSTKERKVDKGIEIEMGYDEEKPKIEEKETDVKPEKEIKTEKPDKPEKIEKFVGFPSHSILDGLLKTYVSSAGVVDYKGLKNEEAKLDQYLKILETNAPGTTWNRDQELVYWINAYNAYTIKLILNNYPVKSITNIAGGKPWDVKWIRLDGQTLSLNNIENDIIRPKYNEPRIHFAVNCAAKSCPPLLNGAYFAKTLDAQLESQTKKFINNPAYNTLDKNEIKVSKIFEWYGADFGDISSFVLRYADITIKPSAKVTYMEYDWNLNGK